MMGLFSVIAFLVGWFIFGLLGAVILAIIVMVVMALSSLNKKELMSHDV